MGLFSRTCVECEFEDPPVCGADPLDLFYLGPFPTTTSFEVKLFFDPNLVFCRPFPAWPHTLVFCDDQSFTNNFPFTIPYFSTVTDFEGRPIEIVYRGPVLTGSLEIRVSVSHRVYKPGFHGFASSNQFDLLNLDGCTRSSCAQITLNPNPPLPFPTEDPGPIYLNGGYLGINQALVLSLSGEGIDAASCSPGHSCICEPLAYRVSIPLVTGVRKTLVFI